MQGTIIFLFDTTSQPSLCAVSEFFYFFRIAFVRIVKLGRGGV